MKKEVPIIPPIDRDLIRQELTPQRFVRKTKRLDNEVYIVNHHNAPNVVREIGRLRELSFRSSGGGTGMALDLDEFDTSERCYEQMIIYNPRDREIVGGYRFIDCAKAYNPATGQYELSTLHYFDFSPLFYEKYLPHTIELGRSWIQPAYQSGNTDSRQSLYALDNLWDGLGGIVATHPHVEYLFGKVTMYPDFDRMSRDALLHFMHYYFPDPDRLVVPKKPLGFDFPRENFLDIFEGKDYKTGYRNLVRFMRSRNHNIPPLINSYMNLSSTMKVFGTAMNNDFGAVEETGILVTIADIRPSVLQRYLMKNPENKQPDNHTTT